ncbi:hypothetical protein LPJ70_006858, partial [Coemansia sp. RSA 2708]
MSKYLERSAKALKENAVKIYNAEFMNRQAEYTVARVAQKSDLDIWVKGSDRDIGGFSDA